LKRLLLVDFNNLLYRAFNVHDSLHFAGKSTGGVYGFINQLSTLLSKYPTPHVIVCSDSPPYLRSKDYPDYKLRRARQKDPDREKAIAQNRQFALDFLELMSIDYWEEKGLEADDLIAIACKKYHKEFDQVIVASNDDDLYQLFKFGNVYFKSKKGNKESGLYGFEEFKKEYPDLSLEDWLRILTMAGTHNDLPGIRGIGEVTAFKIIREGTYRKTYRKHKKTIDLFSKLIRLPYHDDVEVPPAYAFGFNERKLMKFLAGKGIEYSGHMKKAFSIFNS